MAIKIQNIIEAVEDNGLKCLVHGPAGVGKTILCATTGAPTIIISNESGLRSIKGAIENGILPSAVLKLVKIIQIKSIEDLQDAYDLFSDSEEKLCDWICLDSVSEIAEIILAKAKEDCKDPRQAYGTLADDMTDLLKNFRDLPNYNVLMTCKQERTADSDTGRTMYLPMLPGARLTKEISYLFDEVFALRVEQEDDGEEYRVLQTVRDRNYEAKDRSGHLEKFEEPSLFAITKKLKAAHDEFDYSDFLEGVEKNEQKSETENETEEEESGAGEVEKVEEVAEKEVENDSKIASKKMYWRDKTDGELRQSEKGDDITEISESEDWESISKLKFIKQQEAQESSEE